MWGNILSSIHTFSAWKAKGDDAILSDALFRFYRTDLVMAHSGDLYIWDIEKGLIDLRLQVYMILRRYREFLSGHLLIDPAKVTRRMSGRTSMSGTRAGDSRSRPSGTPTT